MAKKEKSVQQLQQEYSTALARYTNTPSSPYLQGEVIKAKSKLDKAIRMAQAEANQGKRQTLQVTARQCSIF